MKKLLILRHAKSSWDLPELADHDRPLAKRGKRDSFRMGDLAKEEGLSPDLILSSTAKRARSTAKRFAEANDYDCKIRFTRDLYLAGAEDYINLLRGLDSDLDCVMVVGHNPGLEELLSTLTGESQWMPTTALAQVELPIQQWKELTEEVEGKLVNYWRPRDLG
jgi:phosphohistidine phosphatase